MVFQTPSIVTSGLSSRLIYPNPFQPTGIEFELSDDAVVTVKILDETGMDVETLMERQRCSAGKHVVSINPEKDTTKQFWYHIEVVLAGKISVDTRQIR
jgi:hypothetical protein